MKKLLFLAGIVAGTVAPYLPAYADPHDHECRYPVDTDCQIGFPGGTNCDLYIGDVATNGPQCLNGVSYVGGCGFDSGTDPTGEIANEDTYTGAIYAAVIGYDPHPASNPVTVDWVRCNLYVNGTIADSEFFPGAGGPVATGASDTSFVAHDGDVVELCDVVSINGTVFPEDCGVATHIEIPPQEFWDIVDPVVCEVLKQLAPITNPILSPTVHIDPASGDTSVNGELFFDCPPYGV